MNYAVMVRGYFRLSLFLLIAIGYTIVVLGCRTPIQFEKRITPDSSFQSKPAQTSELINYKQAARYSEREKGLAVLIWKNGNIVFEEYQNGFSADRSAHIFSGTKTFTGVLALAAIADGKIKLDDNVSEVLEGWQADPCKKKIKVRHLLDFTSGLEQEFGRLSRDGMFIKSQQRITDKYNYAARLGCDYEPGEKYQYGSSHHLALGAYLKKKLNEDPLLYLERRIFKPIGFRYAGWHRDPAGNAMLPYGAWTTAREWLKFGVFLMNKGRKGNRQLIPARLIDEMTTGSQAMPAYGLSVWLNKKVKPEQRSDLLALLRKNARQGTVVLPGGPEDLFVAAGFNGNRLYVVPSKAMIIVRMGDSNSFRDAEFLKSILIQ